jgi:hypothetical protein
MQQPKSDVKHMQSLGQSFQNGNDQFHATGAKNALAVQKYPENYFSLNST